MKNIKTYKAFYENNDVKNQLEQLYGKNSSLEDQFLDKIHKNW